ncbi:MAG: BamA/TamA family outer membrane protein [Prevotella sp.]|nr:BamA/TamA family outer membrane protein [Prevotella sp.]
MTNKIISNILSALSALIVIMAVSGCSTTRNIPDGMFLLDKVSVVSDNKQLDAENFEPYVRQRGSSKWFSKFNNSSDKYTLSDADSASRKDKALKRKSEKSLIFDSLKATQTCNDLAGAMRDLGYIHATADYRLDFHKNKRVNVVYRLHNGKRYVIGNVRYDIQDYGIAKLMNDNGMMKPYLSKGQPFLIRDLEYERKRITTFLNNNGYFNFNRDFISFTADTSRNSTDVDLTLHIQKYRTGSNKQAIDHKQYTISRINFHPIGDNQHIPLRRRVLEETTMFEEGKLYNADDLQKTYNRFGMLPAVKYTNIRFTEDAETNTLACDIGVSTNKTNSISFQPEGTNTAGDLGAAASLTYENKNLFKGSETFSIKLRGAYEAITGLEGYQNQDYEEYNLETKLMFPRFMFPFLSKKFRRQSMAVSELSASYNLQNRPEFHRRVFTAAWRYRWSNSSQKKNYRVDVIDLNYIYMPWISATFKENYLDNAGNRNSILRYNYEDLFIMKLGFSMSANNKNEAFRINVESAGNLLSGLTRTLGMQQNNDKQYTLFNIAFAQYVKGDFDYTKIVPLNNNNNIALHCGFGIAYPYGNSKVLPFEKRYFSGGANSVRGWSVRQLGPGKFKGTDGAIDFINQTGDMKLDLNVELRSFLFWKIYGAAFVDAGNIWTLRYYNEQEGGQFDIKDFYKQIAVAYGLGIRLNFDYFILRFDMGMKAINPAYDTEKEHYAVFHPDFSRDFAFHFAVGLPF